MLTIKLPVKHRRSSTWPQRTHRWWALQKVHFAQWDLPKLRILSAKSLTHSKRKHTLSQVARHQSSPYNSVVSECGGTQIEGGSLQIITMGEHKGSGIIGFGPLEISLWETRKIQNADMFCERQQRMPQQLAHATHHSMTWCSSN